MSEYTVKSVKTFRGREGMGFNATLCRDGKKVALVDDAANGGSYSYHWLDYKEGRKVEVDIVNWQGKAVKMHCTPEQAKFVEHVRAHTKETFEPEDRFVVDLVDDFEEAKTLKRWCRTKTVIILKGDAKGNYHTFNDKYSAAMKAYIEKKYGDQVAEIVNERFVA